MVPGLGRIQEEINRKLGDRIKQFEENVRKAAKEIIEEEFESRIRQIVKEEIKLG